MQHPCELYPHACHFSRSPVCLHALIQLASETLESPPPSPKRILTTAHRTMFLKLNDDHLLLPPLSLLSTPDDYTPVLMLSGLSYDPTTLVVATLPPTPTKLVLIIAHRTTTLSANLAINPSATPPPNDCAPILLPRPLIQPAPVVATPPPLLFPFLKLIALRF